MEAVLLMGVQAAGKSSFYQKNFFRTHLRINLDMLRTRRREQQIFDVCLASGQRFVIDNTNLTRSERARYVSAARASGFRTVGYYLQSQVEACLQRNRLRSGKECLPDRAILAAHRRLEIPTLAEGFDALFYVRIEGEEFTIEEWRHEV